MYLSDVLDEVALSVAGEVTEATLVWLLPCVYPDVSLEVVKRRKTLQHKSNDYFVLVDSIRQDIKGDNNTYSWVRVCV